MKTFIYTIIIFLFCSSLQAQDENLALGQWRSLLPYSFARYVTQTPTEVWFASDMSIVRFDKSEFSTSFLDKIDGLSDINISILEYSEENNMVVAIYSNSNIDLISEDGNSIYNMDDIKRKVDLQGDKTIYDIYFYNDEAYLATGFGIVKISLARQEIEYTTFTNLKINSFTSHNGYFYAASDEGIYTAPINNTNLQDFGNWTRLNTPNGFPEDYLSNEVYQFNDQLYVDVNDTLFIWNNNSLEYILHHDDYQINYINEGNNKLIVNFYVPPPLFGQEIYFVFNDNTHEQPLSFGCISGSGSSAIEDEIGRLWIADFAASFRIFDTNNGTCLKQTFNSPYDITNANLDIGENGTLWLASGTISAGFQYGGNIGGFASYQQGEWTIHNAENETDLLGLQDVIDIQYNPNDGKVYAASHANGLIVYDGENFEIFNDANSILEKPIDDDFGIRVPGIIFDNDGNLWMANNSVSRPIVVRQPDGNWKSFSANGTQSLIKPTIDLSGNKWFTTYLEGVVVFNEGNDWNNDADNSVRVLNTSNSQLPTSNVNDIAVDHDGDVWVGTAQGTVVFECGSNVFNSDCQGTKRIVVREDGNNAYLLESEDVRCIAVDGANRKWFGTTNGIFVTSEDGLDELFHFTVDNSPLFSNKINDIVIDPESGEVYIGTDAGVISYKGDATEGGIVHNPNVFAYPNPVEPDYDGPIAIKGLPQNASIKITDVTGTLVYETQANGGQAIWNGRDYNGRKASSGVYLVFSANENNLANPDGFVTKILFMK